jgi:hypothetical protein
MNDDETKPLPDPILPTESDPGSESIPATGTAPAADVTDDKPIAETEPGNDMSDPAADLADQDGENAKDSVGG